MIQRGKSTIADSVAVGDGGMQGEMEVLSGGWWYAVGDGCILKGMVVCHGVCRYEVGDGGMQFYTKAVQWGMVCTRPCYFFGSRSEHHGITQD
mgnify:CR=1 FL=1